MKIVLDPDPTAPPATLRTAARAWGAVGEGATHHLVLQDDVELCAGAHGAVLAAAAAVPDQPLAFFTNWASRTSQMVRLAALTGATWAPVLDPYTPTQALLLPAELAREFAEYARTLDPTTPDNQAISAFILRSRLTTLVSTPNLAEHTSIDSLLWHDIMFGTRHSVLFPGDSAVLPDEFTSHIIEAPSIPHFESLSGFCVVFTRPAPGSEPSSSAGHEVLIRAGMSNADIVGLFQQDLSGSPDATPEACGFGYPLIFQLWLTTFVFGITASAVLRSADAADLGLALQRRWALLALSTLPPGTVRRLVPTEYLAVVSERFAPLCLAALRSGFGAAATWPMLFELFGSPLSTEPVSPSAPPRHTGGCDGSGRHLGPG